MFPQLQLPQLLLKALPYILVAVIVAIIVGSIFTAGYKYKGYLIDKAALEAREKSQTHYEAKQRGYIDTVGKNQVEYENKVKEIDNDKTSECTNIAPKCLVDAF